MLGRLSKYVLAGFAVAMIFYVWDLWLEQIPYGNINITITKGCETERVKIKADYAKRIHQIKEACSKLNYTRIPLHRRHFIINEDHKLVYCWIHKVASTSWIAVFTTLMNQSQPEHLYYKKIVDLSAKNLEELKNASRDEAYLKFLVVRHPFERLVSAYRDRIQDSNHFTFQAKKYAARILSYSRPSVFNDTLIFYHKKLAVVPTFEEFIRWLINSSSKHYDIHWNLYNDHCAPCNIQYDAVIKLEHKKEAANFLRGLTNVDISGVSLPHLQKSFGGETNFKVTCYYLSQLSSKQIHQLYEIYKIDFIIFNYSFDMYLNCTK